MCVVVFVTKPHTNSHAESICNACPSPKQVTIVLIQQQKEDKRSDVAGGLLMAAIVLAVLWLEQKHCDLHERIVELHLFHLTAPLSQLESSFER